MSVDSQIFRGIFVQAIGHIARALPQGVERTRLSLWLHNEGLAVWKNRYQKARFNATWENTPRKPSAQAQITAANLFVAAAPFVSGAP